MHRATFSHPHLQLVAHVAGRQRRSAKREREQRHRDFGAYDVQGCPHTRGDTLPKHTERSQKERESGTHEKKAHAVRARKTEVNRKKTEMDSHLEATEPESQKEGKDSLSEKYTHTEKPIHRKRELPR